MHEYQNFFVRYEEDRRRCPHCGLGTPVTVSISYTSGHSCCKVEYPYFGICPRCGKDFGIPPMVDIEQMLVERIQDKSAIRMISKKPSLQDIEWAKSMADEYDVEEK